MQWEVIGLVDGLCVQQEDGCLVGGLVGQQEDCCLVVYGKYVFFVQYLGLCVQVEVFYCWVLEGVVNYFDGEDYSFYGLVQEYGQVRYDYEVLGFF